MGLSPVALRKALISIAAGYGRHEESCGLRRRFGLQELARKQFSTPFRLLKFCPSNKSTKCQQTTALPYRDLRRTAAKGKETHQKGRKHEGNLNVTVTRNVTHHDHRANPSARRRRRRAGLPVPGPAPPAAPPGASTPAAPLSDRHIRTQQFKLFCTHQTFGYAIT